MPPLVSSCTFRLASALDQPTVDAWASDKETRYFSPLGLLNDLDDPSTFNFIVENDDTAVGVLTLVAEKDTASVYLYIGDEHKNKGLGNLIASFLPSLLPTLQSALPKEVRYLLVEVDQAHEQVYRIMTKAGWARRPDLDDAVHTRFHSFLYTLPVLSR